MAINTLNDGADIRAPKPWDQKEGYWDSSSNSWKPFNDVGHALSLLVEAYRFIGLTVPVMEEGEQVEYWFVGGVLDEHFVLKGSSKSPPEFHIIPADPSFDLMNPTYTSFAITADMRDKYGDDPYISLSNRESGDPSGLWREAFETNLSKQRGVDNELLSITFTTSGLETLLIIK